MPQPPRHRSGIVRDQRGALATSLEVMFFVPFLLTGWFGMVQLAFIQIAGASAAHAANNAARAAMVAAGPGGEGMALITRAAVVTLASTVPLFDELGSPRWKSLEGMNDAVARVTPLVKIEPQADLSGPGGGAMATITVVYEFPCAVPFAGRWMCEQGNTGLVARIERSATLPVHVRTRL